MKSWTSFRALLAYVFRRARVEREMEEELRSHLQARADDLERKGLSRKEAERQARVEFGGYERYKEECRDALGSRLFGGLVADIRYGLRRLRRSPGFTAVAVLTLALGIGANTAIFSIVDAVLLKPLPYPESGRIVHVLWAFQNDTAESVTGTEFEFWREHNRVFECAAAVGLFPDGANLRSGDHADYVKALTVSRDFFRTLDVQPFLGRGFSADEDRPNGPKAAILSYSLWQRRFGSDPAVVGHPIALDDESKVARTCFERSAAFPFARLLRTADPSADGFALLAPGEGDQLIRAQREAEEEIGGLRYEKT